MPASLVCRPVAHTHAEGGHLSAAVRPRTTVRHHRAFATPPCVRHTTVRSFIVRRALRSFGWRPPPTAARAPRPHPHTAPTPPTRARSSSARQSRCEFDDAQARVCEDLDFALALGFHWSLSWLWAAECTQDTRVRACRTRRALGGRVHARHTRESVCVVCRTRRAWAAHRCRRRGLTQ